MKAVVYPFSYRPAKRGESTMVEVYATLIARGRRKINQIPEQLRDAVLVVLNERGLDGEGNPVQNLTEQ
ncbi:hypothetical protein GTO89_06310 [Heliobacterium gestii]|uniref:Uncharacterized protein n=1 Tax=Heliomicrobium gestii TaxID=2699 RepID=A0A845LCJ6_HELGE|nr:CD1375 family protein [Heliomicrobium gestii]MBM7866017.1 hypothetical protein [Heliomicrobium gestii]MZP42650.1 hypothetical protein [Heliomicrobium gestii]